MRTINEHTPRDEENPLRMLPETTDEQNLVTTLRVLVASGKVTEADVMVAWKLGFSD